MKITDDMIEKESNKYFEAFGQNTFKAGANFMKPEIVKLENQISYLNDVVRERDSWAAMSLKTSLRLEKQIDTLVDALNKIEKIVDTFASYGGIAEVSRDTIGDLYYEIHKGKDYVKV